MIFAIDPAPVGDAAGMLSDLPIFFALLAVVLFLLPAIRSIGSVHTNLLSRQALKELAAVSVLALLIGAVVFAAGESLMAAFILASISATLS